jgi:hypothetical protein
MARATATGQSASQMTVNLSISGELYRVAVGKVRPVCYFYPFYIPNRNIFIL